MNITIKEIIEPLNEYIKVILDLSSQSQYISVNYDNIKHYIESAYNKVFLSFNSDNMAIGFIIFSHIDDEIDITDLVISENYRNSGYGSAVLSSIMEYAKKNRVSKITLEVNEKNIAAINFYRKHMFTLDGVRENYYKNKYNAILMSIVIIN